MDKARNAYSPRHRVQLRGDPWVLCIDSATSALLPRAPPGAGPTEAQTWASSLLVSPIHRSRFSTLSNPAFCARRNCGSGPPHTLSKLSCSRSSQSLKAGVRDASRPTLGPNPCQFRTNPHLGRPARHASTEAAERGVGCIENPNGWHMMAYDVILIERCKIMAAIVRKGFESPKQP